MGLIDSLFIGIGVDTKEAEHEIHGLGESFRELGEHVERISHIETFEFLKEQVKGVLERFEHVGEAAEQLNNMAYAAGVTADQLQRLQYAANQSGVSSEQLNGAMSHLSRTLQMARSGSKEAVEQFAQVGITPEQINSFKNTQEALDAFSEGLKNNVPKSQQAAVTMQVLGRSSANMARLLGRGKKAIHEVGEEGAKLGAVVSPEDLLSLEEASDAIASLWAIVKGVTMTLLSDFAPSIKKTVDVVKSWWKANHEIIVSKLRDWIAEFIGDITFMMGVIANLIEWVRGWAKEHEGLIHSLERVAGAIKDGVVAAIKWMIKSIDELLHSNSELAQSARAWIEFAGSVVLARYAFLLMGKAGLAIRAIFMAVRGVILGVRAATTLATIEVWAALAAFVAIGVILKSLYDMMFGGKSFKETWLGQLVNAPMAVLKKIPGMKLLFGNGEGDSPNAGAGASGIPSSLERTDAVPDSLRKPAPLALISSPDQVAGLIQAGNNLGAISDMAEKFGGTKASPIAAGALDPSGAMMPNVTNNIDASGMQITIPSGIAEDKIPDYIAKAMEKFADQRNRQAQRALGPGVRF